MRNLTLVAILFAFIASSCGVYQDIQFKFPKNTKAIINKALEEPVTDGYMGVQDTAYGVDSVAIWYESIGDPNNNTVLLVMGYNTNATAWHNDFIQLLLDDGFHVVRFDNRDGGLSGFTENWHRKTAYDLNIMALDAIMLLDHLNIEKAHVAGISMGGMIAQTMAINYPDRLLSLTSISSTGYLWDEEITTLQPSVIGKFFITSVKHGYTPSNFHRFAKGTMEVDAFMSNCKEVDEDFVYSATKNCIFEIADNRVNSQKTAVRQLAAMKKAGSRLDKLSQINIPTLVIHGKEDPLIVFEHGQKVASLIPNADTLWIDDMGHIPLPKHFPVMHEKVKAFAKRVDNATAQKAQLD